MKLQKIIERLQKLHPKKIDLNLDRIQNLCKKLGNPQENLDCISFVGNSEEGEMRLNLSAPALNGDQDLYVSEELPTSRVMVKDEDVCLHCGLCAERCPTNAWDMQRSVVHIPQLGSFAE